MEDFSLDNANKTLPKKTAGNNAELAALRNTIAFLNNPEVTGAVVPPEEKQEIERMLNEGGAVHPTQQDLDSSPATRIKDNTGEDRTGATITGDPVIQAQAKAKPVQQPRPRQPAPPVTPINATKFFFTGKLCAGKDHVAKAAGFQVFGFADPIYKIASHFFGIQVDSVTNKDLPGMREFLQTVGQWGRGEVNAQYPYSPLRAVFITMVRSLGAAGILPPDVSWSDFGSDLDLWAKSLIARATGEGIAVTNCRYENEFTLLKGEGFSHWHVICSPGTWNQRLAARGIQPGSKQLEDMSEKLASKLNGDVIKELSVRRQGNKLRVIWNDDQQPSPSPRLYTLPEFLAGLNTRADQNLIA